jgi:hypothetical protein
MDIEQVCEGLRGIAGRLGAIDVGESVDPAGIRRGMTELSGVRAAVMRLQLAFTSRAAVQAETGDAPAGTGRVDRCREGVDA